MRYRRDGRRDGFYRDTLGMDCPIWDDTPRWQEFQSEPVAFALREDRPGAGSNAAIALAVEDVSAAVEELRAKGVTIEGGPFEAGVCSSALIRDPDGNLLLLHQRKDGTRSPPADLVNWAGRLRSSARCRWRRSPNS